MSIVRSTVRTLADYIVEGDDDDDDDDDESATGLGDRTVLGLPGQHSSKFFPSATQYSSFSFPILS